MKTYITGWSGTTHFCSCLFLPTFFITFILPSVHAQYCPVMASVQTLIHPVDQPTNDVSSIEVSQLPIVFVMGGPGSGKGTQCALIKDRYGFCHLSTGDLLRDEVASGSPRGAWLSSIMVKGDLVPLEVVLNLLKEAILREAQHGAKGFLIDGFPREVSQAMEFEKQVGLCSQVIYFEVPFDIMEERLLQRGITSGRADDNATTIRKRLQTFADQTIPVVSHYQKINKTTIISANRDINSIFADVTSALKVPSTC